MKNSVLLNWIKSIITLLVLFLTFSGVTCEVISEKVAIKLQEAYCDAWCSNEVNCKCSSWTELQFQNNTSQINIEWLCRDETIISFRWSSDKKLTYVFEYSENGNWSFCDTTRDNLVVLEDLHSGGEYQIKVWGVSADRSVYGPFFSQVVKTIKKYYYPLEVPKFKLVDWEFVNGTSLNAILEWTPAEDRLCFYEIMVHSEKRYEASRYMTKDMKSLFRTKVLGFNNGENYIISISPKLSNSFSSISSGPSKWISVTTPNCLELYQSVEKCVPNLPENVNVNEEISKYFQRWFLNITFDVHVTWSKPKYIPDNYTLEIIVFENEHPRIVQNVTGKATRTVFYNVTVTPHYNLKMTLWSKAGSSKSLTIDRMITIQPDMIAVTNSNEYNSIIIILLSATCSLNILIVLGMCLIKLRNN